MYGAGTTRGTIHLRQLRITDDSPVNGGNCRTRDLLPCGRKEHYNSTGHEKEIDNLCQLMLQTDYHHQRRPFGTYVATYSAHPASSDHIVGITQKSRQSLCKYPVRKADRCIPKYVNFSLLVGNSYRNRGAGPKRTIKTIKLKRRINRKTYARKETMAS